MINQALLRAELWPALRQARSVITTENIAQKVLAQLLCSHMVQAAIAVEVPIARTIS